MRRLFFLVGALATTTLWGCGSDGSNINQPSGHPGNSISVVRGAQTKGTGAFAPNPFTITLAGGGVVQWFNDDQTEGPYGGSGVTHNITADDNSFVSGALAPGGSFKVTFSAQGSYPYHCSIHPTMKGTVTVTP